MTQKLRTLVIYWEDRFRKESRHQVGKVESGKIILEIPVTLGGLSNETWEEIAVVNPQLVLLELSKDPRLNLTLLRELQQNFPGIPVLAAGESLDSAFLIEALRLGVKEVLSKPLTTEAVQHAFDRVQRQSGAAGQAKEAATIFSFFSCKGGSGSTAISTNFAVSLSKLSRKKILVLDLDVELGDVAGFFGLKSPNLWLKKTQKARFSIQLRFLEPSLPIRRQELISSLSATVFPREQGHSQERLRYSLLYCRQNTTTSSLMPQVR